MLFTSKGGWTGVTVAPLRAPLARARVGCRSFPWSGLGAFCCSAFDRFMALARSITKHHRHAVAWPRRRQMGGEFDPKKAWGDDLRRSSPNSKVRL